MGAGAPGAQATILGTREKVSTVGAGFANGELMNALDFDAILPPGHVSPYVLPGALAVQEGAIVGAAALVGVPPTAALAAALVRRAREVCFAVPGLLAWHRSETRGMPTAPAAARGQE